MKHNPHSAAKVRCWTVTPPLRSEPEPTATRTPSAVIPGGIRFGYTLNDLDRLARTVVVANAQWWSGGDRRDQAETAWQGIVEHLYVAAAEPSERDLLAAGTRALVEETKGWRRHHGLTDTGTPAPRHAAYWYEPPAEPWEERLIERIAVEQVLARVAARATAAQIDALMALAATGDYAAAAKVLGIRYEAFGARLRAPRAEFSFRWHAPDRPPTRRGTDRRVGSYAKPLATHCLAGHEWTPENTRWSRGRNAAAAKVRRCRACQADRDRERAEAKAAAT